MSLRVPGEKTVRWLGEESVRRYSKLQKQDKTKENKDSEKVQEVRKTRGGVILDPDDRISDVLDDNDFVTVGKQNCVLRQQIYVLNWKVENTIYHQPSCINVQSDCIGLLYVKTLELLWDFVHFSGNHLPVWQETFH